MDTILFFQPRRYGSWRKVLTGLQRFAREKNWLVHVLSRPDDDDMLGEVVENWAPLGCIMDCSDGERPPSDQALGKTPVLFFNRDSRQRTRHPVLHQDSTAIAGLAAEHLLGLELDDYAFAPHPSRADWSQIRESEFAARIRRAGRHVHVAADGITADWLCALPRPCGLFAANDAVAQQVVALAQKRGLLIPDDLAVLGVDNDEIYCEGTVPGLSSIALDHDAIGYRLGELLDAEIGHPAGSARSHACDTAHLVLRGSTRRLFSPEPGVMEAVDLIRRFACSDNIRVDDVAARMHCSRREATQRFRRATGRSILEEIHEVRFRRMCELLETTDMKVSAIINFFGYASEAFPKRMFVQRTGMTMRAFRRSLRT